MRIKLGIVAAAVGVVAAAGGTAAVASPAPGHPDALPGYGAAVHQPGHRKVIKLTVADNGRTIHVVRGQEVRVALAVKLKQNPDASTWWHPVTETGDALKALPQTLMARRGVTLGRYGAVAKGEAELSSSRAVCPQQPGTAACHSMQGWKVTIDVR